MAVRLVRASFLRVVSLLAVLALGTDLVFFVSLPAPYLAGLVAAQALLLGLTVFFGLRNIELVRDDDGNLYHRFVLPNVLTLGRVLAIPGVVVDTLQADWDRKAALGTALLFSFAAVSDLLDGAISRRFSRASMLGRVLDPLADALFYTSLSVALTIEDAFPLWLSAAAVARFVPSMLGGLWIFSRHGPLEIAPTLLGKASSFAFGIATALAVARVTAGPRLPPEVDLSVALAAAALSVAAVVEYVRLGLRVLGRQRAPGTGAGAAGQ